MFLAVARKYCIRRLGQVLLIKDQDETCIPTRWTLALNVIFDINTHSPTN